MPNTIEISRLRAGEVASGLGAMVLLGWRGRRQFPVLRWLSVIAGVSGLALPYTQATRRAPALPVSLSVVVTALGGATTLGLASRVLVGRKAGPPSAAVGLVAAAGIAGGGFLSMRQESGTDPATLGEMETIKLDS